MAPMPDEPFEILAFGEIEPAGHAGQQHPCAGDIDDVVDVEAESRPLLAQHGIL